MLGDKNEELLDEIKKQRLDEDNKMFGIVVVFIVVILIALINLPGVVVGIVMYLKNKFLGFLISIITIISSLIISLIYGSIVKIPIVEQFKIYFFNILGILDGDFNIVQYLFKPLFIFFGGVSIFLSMLGMYFWKTTNNEESAWRQGRKRYNKDDGRETSFLKEVNLKSYKRYLPKNLEGKVTHNTVNGTFLGISNNADNVVITDKEASTHGLVIGSTGRGKTVALLNFVESCAERNLTCIYVDGKRDEELPDKMRKLAEKFGRKFYHFDIRGVLSDTCYNPLRVGDFDNIKEKLIDITDWSEEHYKVNAERVLMLIVRVIEQVLIETKDLQESQMDEYFDLKEGDEKIVIKKDVICIQSLLLPVNLNNVIESIKNEELKDEFKSIFNRLKEDWYGGLESRLALIAESNIKNLVKDTEEGINLLSAFEEKAMVLFSLDSLKNRNVTQMMGRLIVKDVNTAVSLRIDIKNPAYAIYDEHGAYISEDIDSQFAMARSYGLGVITSTQNVADYKKSNLGDILMRKVIGNTNFKLILMQNEPEDAEYLAETIGTNKVIDRTVSSDYNNSYKGSGIKYVDEFIVHPNTIKDLGIGEAVLIKKTPEKKVITDIKIKFIDFSKIKLDVNQGYEEEESFVVDKVESKKSEGMKIRNPLSRRKKRLGN
ncbi:MAG: TraM recognition domain-containing protein [Fusobacteriaceae bacterium]|nr:TraM recognition domain-containing protein [Fusobacteriaceae bacterium]